MNQTQPNTANGEEQVKKGREWVKTAAIIFLAVLLVLTFFSNTILNMTLPEVSTQYIQYGAIKTQVRGNGTIVAQDARPVSIDYARKIERVAVKQGDTVKKGDVLFVLSPSQGDELTEAQNAYDTLNYEYTKLLIDSAQKSDSTESLILSLNQTNEDLEEARRKLENIDASEAAKADAKAQQKLLERQITAKQSEIEDMKKDLTAIGYTPTEDEVLTGRTSDVSYEEYAEAAALVSDAEEKLAVATDALNAAKNESSAAERERSQASKRYEAVASQIKTPTTTLEESLQQSDRAIDTLDRDIKYIEQDYNNQSKNYDVEKLYNRFKDYQSKFRAAKAKYDDLVGKGASEDEIREAKAAMDAAAKTLDDAYEVYYAELTGKQSISSETERKLGEKRTELQYELEKNTKLREELEKNKVLEEKLIPLKAELDKADAALDSATARTNAAQTVYDNANTNKEKTVASVERVRNGYKYARYLQQKQLIDEKTAELDALSAELDRQKEIVSELESATTESATTLKERVKTLEREVLKLQNDLEKQSSEKSSTEKKNSLEIERKKKDLDKAATKLQELKEVYQNNTVLAPVGGIVETIHTYAGKKTTPGESLLDIALSEQGGKLTLTATREQASKLRIGMNAEITSYISYGNDVKIVLDAIRNDTANPSSNQKILEFSVTGDVTPGQTLSIAVGDKNVSYDSTVPNSAIHEDSEGKYILIIESKDTPISTRYTAKRVAVNVLASDDTRSAISGDFQNYAYIIVSSSKPIENGKQVRLLDN